MSLQGYPAYSESGAGWLGQVPAHWNIVPAFAELQEQQIPNKGLAESQVLSLSYGRVIIKPKDKLHGLVPASFETYQIVNPGNVILRLTDLQNDQRSLRVGLAKDRGIITSAYLCLRLKNLTPGYAYYLLHSADVQKVFYGMGSGLRQTMGFAEVRRMPIAVPPLDEQATIVRYLDAVDRRVNQLLRAKRRLIALLNEQKQIIIHRAVTRGLDLDAPTKPSGVDWLGEIPAHWTIGVLRRFWDVVDCKHLTVPFMDDGIPLASVVEVQSFDLNLSTAKHTSSEWYENLISGCRKPKRGDLIYCRNASVGASAYVNTDIDFAMGQDVCLITSRDQNQRFLNYLLQSPLIKRQLARMQVGSTFKRVNISQIRSFVVTVPPRFEQNKICSLLDSSCCTIDNAISRAEKVIERIREYRTRLIADVVTGKLDVRNAPLPGEEEGVEWAEEEDSGSDEQDTDDEPEMTTDGDE